MKQHHMVATFVGPAGEYHNGIPSRDLSADEYDRLTDEQRDLLKASKLYEVKPEPAAKPAPVKPEPVPVPAAAAPAPKDEAKK